MTVLEEFSLEGKTAILATRESAGDASLTPFLAEALEEAGATVRVLASSHDELVSDDIGTDADVGRRMRRRRGKPPSRPPCRMRWGGGGGWIYWSTTSRPGSQSPRRRSACPSFRR